MLLVTADHGNIEQMRDPETGEPHTAHTTNLVPLVIAGAAIRGRPEATVSHGRLCDIAPTVLGLMGLTIPAEMTGVNLLATASIPATEVGLVDA